MWINWWPTLLFFYSLLIQHTQSWHYATFIYVMQKWQILTCNVDQHHTSHLTLTFPGETKHFKRCIFIKPVCAIELCTMLIYIYIYMSVYAYICVCECGWVCMCVCVVLFVLDKCIVDVYNSIEDLRKSFFSYIFGSLLLDINIRLSWMIDIKSLVHLWRSMSLIWISASDSGDWLIENHNDW